MNKTIKLLILLILCLSTSSAPCFHEKNDASLIQKTAFFIKNQSLSVSILLAMIYFHKDITNDIQNHPYVSIIAATLMTSHMCNVILNIQQQKSILKAIILVKKITFYLAVSIGIKNYFENYCEINNQQFNGDIFLDNIVEGSGYTFNEITELTINTYHEIQEMIENQNFLLHVCSEEYAYLCFAKHISLDNLHELAHKEKEIEASINLTIENPEKYISAFPPTINLKINPLIYELKNYIKNNNF